jgi:hypothetical protein
MPDLTPDTFKTIPWHQPWRYVGIGEGGGYERELMQEAGPGHPLHNVRAIAVGARIDQDDVLFLLPDGPKPLAVVHLTYSSNPPDPSAAANVPHTTFYSSLDDWLGHGMIADQNMLD